jgi:phospholipase C
MGHITSSGIINSLMNSPSWKDSALLLTYDEAGGFYDHVSPQPMALPGDIAKPIDLLPGDICTIVTGPTCSFDYTGYRDTPDRNFPFQQEELCLPQSG